MQIGFFGLLTILFVALKLTGVIAWNWALVLAPAWIGIVLWFTIMLIILYSTYTVGRNK